MRGDFLKCQNLVLSILIRALKVEKRRDFHFFLRIMRALIAF